MDRVVAVVVLLLGSLLLAATAVGMAADVRDDEPVSPVPRLLVAVLAGYGMYRAWRKVRASRAA